jgi:TatD DNase family protein
MGLIDSHCHLDGKTFAADLDAVIGRARAAGVETLVAVGTGDGPPDLEAGVRLAEAYPFIYATAGVHPHDASKATEETWPELLALSGHPKVVALGEIGLDYHYNFSPPETQRAVFARQLEIAREAGLPVVIHTREAWADTVELIRRHYGDARAGGVFHCFSSGPREAEEAVAMGFHVSFSGIVTFPRAQEVQEAARVVPDERLLVETDAPYLAPVPYRGKRNEPGWVTYTAAALGVLRGVTAEEIAVVTSANWRRLCLGVNR